ncbi:MAG: YeeE/YedE family protein [Calditrichaeota bacterium]|nr:YeeE/YedE family protein [Candidatus Cloacimonadota bacterium]MCB1047481.1 YeeE/YedE family protein [Calditrichota bacterium]MCB9473014.1 YeeE/YedE family protein [Candidatus Delongbacteria bacterium]
MNTKPYWNPYLAGLLLGLALLAAFVVAGQGLGASAFPKRVLAGACDIFSPEWTEGSSAFGSYVTRGNPLSNWLVIQVIGVLIGGFLAALTAGRLKSEVVRSPRISRGGRLWLALLGGIIMGFAAALGRGCTSGQALSGGAALASGSWAFMMMVFAGGYSVAWFVRKQWL